MGTINVESETSAPVYDAASSKTESNQSLKLDPHGFPLRPQPSDDPLDPLNWSRTAKFIVLLQVSLLGFMGGFSQGYINPAFASLAKAMGVTVTVASYSTTIAIVFAGVSPLLYSPLSNIYGRRPVYLVSTAIGVAANAASAMCNTWAPLLVARAFVGIGTSVGMGIGASVVGDIYFMHQRGRYMGVYIVFVTSGAHVASLAGGFTAEYIGWRWCYWIPAIVLGAIWLINIFALPETLYHRGPVTGASHGEIKSWVKLFTLQAVRIKRQINLWDITHCFVMFKYPSVLLAGLYYSIAFGVGSVLFPITGAAAFGTVYKFSASQVGLAVGISTTLGSLLGEGVSGLVSDKMLYLADKRNNGHADPEARLHATWPGAFILPAGIIIEGVCLQYNTHWSGPVMGMFIGSFGLQIVSTTIFAYLTDCYKPQSAEISTILNFGRLTFAFTEGFYMIPFATSTTWGIAWAVLAMVNLALYSGVILLMWKGAEWRIKMGKPSFDRTL